MEVHFTPEQEALLSRIANHAGTDTERLVKDAVLRLLEQDARFREGVEWGIAAADRGEFVKHDEVWANVEKILRS
jgi:predicted transcriptional regulator